MVVTGFGNLSSQRWWPGCREREIRRAPTLRKAMSEASPSPRLRTSLCRLTVWDCGASPPALMIFVRSTLSALGGATPVGMLPLGSLSLWNVEIEDVDSETVDTKTRAGNLGTCDLGASALGSCALGASDLGSCALGMSDLRPANRRAVIRMARVRTEEDAAQWTNLD